MKLGGILTHEKLEKEREERKKHLERLTERERIEGTRFYRIMKSIGLEKLADYLTLNDYEKAKDEATERVIAMIPYGR